MDLVDDSDINQGQYDWRDDVLAVSLPGSLVRRSAWVDLGGLDRAFRGFGDSADPLDIDGLVYGVSGGSTTIDVGASFGIGAPGQHTIKLVGFDDLQDSNFAALA